MFGVTETLGLVMFGQYAEDQIAGKASSWCDWYSHITLTDTIRYILNNMDGQLDEHFMPYHR